MSEGDWLPGPSGGSFRTYGVRFELAYQYLSFFSRDSSVAEFPSDYNGQVHIFGVTVGYQM